MEKKGPIDFVIERCLQWLYSTRKKKLMYRIAIVFCVLVIFVLSVTGILSLIVSYLLYPFAGRYIVHFRSILCIVMCTIIVPIIVNWGTEQGKYSKIFLSYYYLKTKKNKNKTSLFQNVLVVGTIVILVAMLTKEMGSITGIMGLDIQESLVVSAIVLALFVYIPLTEAIVDKVKFYRIKKNSAIILFLILLFLFIDSMNENSSGNVIDIYEIVIFAIGQIAFAESAISNHRNLFEELKEENRKELDEYLQAVDKQYEIKEEAFKTEVNEIKKSFSVIKSEWIKWSWKQKLVMIISGVFVTAFTVLLVVLSIKADKIF